MADSIQQFQLACVQFQPTKGDLKATLDHLAETALQAVSEGADLLVYPESATTGYVLEGGVDALSLTTAELCAELEPRFKNAGKTFDIAIGFYESNPRRPFNSAAYLSFDGAKLTALHTYRKIFLPTYGVFDEHRFHEEGSELGVVDTKFGRIGILVCEDVWHSVLSTLLCVAGCELILVHSASPARNFQSDKPGNLIRYDRMLQSLCEEHGVFAAMAMLSGFEGGKGLTGGSQVVAPNGECLVQAKNFGEQIVMTNVDRRLVAQARSGTPLASDLKEHWADIVRMGSKLVD